MIHIGPSKSPVHLSLPKRLWSGRSKSFSAPNTTPALFPNIKQHTPIAQLDEATDLVAKDSSIDTLISVGGGSPVDSAIAISFRQNERTGKFLHHITIPTTLSAAECTSIAGYTKIRRRQNRHRPNPTSFPQPSCTTPPSAPHTPKDLWLSTAIRAPDHNRRAPLPPERDLLPCKQLAL